MPDGWKRIATYPSLVEADLALARLEQAGVTGRVESDDAGGAYPVLQNHGAHLLVCAEDADRATALLNEPIETPDGEDSPELLAAAEQEVARHRGGRTLVFGAPPDIVVLCLLLGFFFGFLASRFGVFSSDFVLSWTADSTAEDLNGDGRADEWITYWGPAVTRVQQDRNFDGEIDATWRYVDTRVSTAERDDDFDGRIDTWEHWAPANIESIRSDVDGDGRPDIDEYYVHGLHRQSDYRPGGGDLERVDVYEKGTLREIYLVDDDGEQKLFLAFDEFGRVIESPAFAQGSPGTKGP